MTRKLPVLPVKDLVVFPHIFIPISVGREFSKKAMFESIDNYSSEVMVLLQKDSNNNNPESKKDFFDLGVVCNIVKKEVMF